MTELRHIAAPRRLIIGTRGQISNQVTRGGGDTNTQHMSRVLFSTGPYPVSEVQAHYWWGRMLGSGSGEGAVGNGAVVEAAFEGNSHAGRRLYFDGALSKTVLDGMLFSTDPHPEAISGPNTTGYISNPGNGDGGAVLASRLGSPHDDVGPQERWRRYC